MYFEYPLRTGFNVSIEYFAHSIDTKIKFKNALKSYKIIVIVI